MEKIEEVKREILLKLKFAVGQEWWEAVDKLSLAYSRLDAAEARMGGGGGGVHT